jgi:MraZ protein
MLIGEFRHQIDSKRRMSLPAKFRKELGKKVIITQGLDNCLFIYPISQWEKVVGKLSELSMGQSDSRAITRFLLAGAVEVEIDSLGRVLLPEYLTDFAGLSSRAVLVGVSERLEVWNEERWDNYKRRTAESADAVAEKLGELGAL